MPSTITPAQREVIEAMQGGDILMCELFTEAGETHRRFLIGTRQVMPLTVKCLERNGLIEPSGDGLFGDTQTYRLKGGQHG